MAGATGGLTPFQRFWIAHGTSVTATGIGAFVLPILAVLELNASAGQVGLISAAQWIPFLFLSLPLGVVVDRVAAKPLVVSAAATRAVLAATIATAAATGLASVPLLMVTALLVGGCTVVYEVTYQSYISELVDRLTLEKANARIQTTLATAQIGAPGVGGALVRWLGTAAVIGIESALHAVSAAVLATLPADPGSPPDEQHRFSGFTFWRPMRDTFWRQMRDGLAVLARDPYLVALAGYSAISNLFEQWVSVLVTVYALRELDIGAAGLGLALTIGAVGALLGAASAAWVERRIGAGITLVSFTAVDCVALASVSLLDPGLSSEYAIAGLSVLWFFNAIGASATTVIALTMRQLRTPTGYLGRVNAGIRWVSYGSIAIGSALGGLAGTLLGVRTGLTIGGLGYLLTLAWVAASPLRSVHHPEDLDLKMNDSEVDGQQSGQS